MSIAQVAEPSRHKPLRLLPGVVIVVLMWLGRWVVPRFGPDAALWGVMLGVFGVNLGLALWEGRRARWLGSDLLRADEDLRAVVVMRYFQELSREEIAEAIGLTLAGAKARLGKAMQALRERLQEPDDSSAT